MTPSQRQLSIGDIQWLPRDCVIIGAGARDNGVTRALSLGAHASPLDDEHPLALGIHPKGVTPFGLGITINGAARTIPLIRKRFTSRYSTEPGLVKLTARSSPDQFFIAGHEVWLPVPSTLEQGITFTLINFSPHEDVVVKTHAGRVKMVLAPKTSADLKCIDVDDQPASTAWVALRVGAVY